MTRATSSPPKHPATEPRAKGADAYRDPSWWYDIRGFFILTGTYQVSLWSHLGFFSDNLGDRHLEAAVGSGTFLWLTLGRNRLRRRRNPSEIVGIDYAERMLRGAKRLFGRNPRVRLLQADLSRIDLPDNHFDSVNIAHSFHAFPDPDAVLTELHRVMKPQAALFVDVLLEPRGGRLRRSLARSVNDFAFRKGILARTCDADRTIDEFRSAGFETANAFINGNTLHLMVRKPAMDGP